MPGTAPKQSVVTSMLDAADGHMAAVEAAALTIARAASGVLTQLRVIDGALKTISVHGENGQAVLDEIRDLRPSIRGRRTDLGVVA